MIASIASTLDITIEGMSCSHCVAKVTKALQTVPGVTVKSVAVGSATVELPSPTAAAAVFAAIHAAGFTAHRSLVAAPAKTGCCGCCSTGS